ncbi:D-alanine--D-alanine ligase family protein [Haliangium sp.]|uniref:D-alanine--D-alanine ligase family protein n=1 Tax=Haliangium sp. TaxID=2663208 RepID=UPI003D0E51F9
MNLGLPLLRRVLVLYNNDYDDELVAAVDVSAVRVSAEAITAAVADAGYHSELMGVRGADLGHILARLDRDPPDLVFNLCESLSGSACHEPVVPAVLDMLGVPYTGTGPLGIGLCLHKDRTKEILRARAVPTPESVVLNDQRALVGADLAALRYPCFLKLVHEDASVGIEAGNRVSDPAALAARARALFDHYRQPILIERYVEGREVNVSLLGNDPAIEVLPLHEIDFGAMPPGRPHIVSYAAKWDEAHVDFAGTRPVPMQVEPALAARIEAVARAAYTALGVRDFGRVDLRVDESGQPWVIDVNPNPDISPDAGLVRAAACAGRTYPELIGSICRTAWSRHGHPPDHDR